MLSGLLTAADTTQAAWQRRPSTEYRSGPWPFITSDVIKATEPRDFARLASAGLMNSVLSTICMNASEFSSAGGSQSICGAYLFEMV